MIVCHVRPEARPGIKKQADDAYAAYAEKVYGTTTPPREAD
jgi:hypothetical protein